MVPNTLKRCKICGQELPRTEFYSHPKTRDRLYHDCKACYRERGRRWHHQNREGVLRRTRNNYLKRNYGITQAEVSALLEQQNGRCAICSSEVSFGRGPHRRACVDHDHETGKVRGILCDRCNSAEGLIKGAGLPLALWSARLVLYLHQSTGASYAHTLS